MGDVTRVTPRLSARFKAKIIADFKGCWKWTAHVNKNGYGRFKANGKMVQAHRWAYERIIGPIPAGLTLDHKCRERSCVNPFHLEPVTNRVNVLRGNAPSARNARKTHCWRGHELKGSNLYVRPNGQRMCRRCHVGRMKAVRTVQRVGIIADTLPARLPA